MKKNVIKGFSILSKIFFLILTLSIIISIFFPQLFPLSQEEAANWVQSHAHDKLVFVLIQIVQVIIPPISHYFTSILGGYIYGPVYGGIFNLIGRVIGQFIAFGIAYFLADWLSKKKEISLDLFKNLVGGRDNNLYLRALIILVMIALPFFPDDELSYAMGFARFPVKIFSLITIIGHVLGSFALAYLGSGEEFKGTLFIGLATSTIVCCVGLIWASIKFQKIKNNV